MSEVKVNKISPRSGTTVTLGDSGDTFTIPSGATINNQGTATNFGATGSASWVTTVKTTDFTAVAGEGYFIDTTSNVVNVALPAGSAGAVVAIADYAKNFNTNKVTLVQNGSDKIGGETVNATVATQGIAVTLVFVDSTKGWVVTDDGLASSASTSAFIAASGGTETTDGNFKVHTFTAPGTFCVSNGGNSCGSNSVEYIVVAGGGGGANSCIGGGGGAGGFRFASPSLGCLSYPAKPLVAPTNAPVTAQSYPIVVGAGGAGGSAGGPNGSCTVGVNGSVSSAISIQSAGGGGGGGRDNPPNTTPPATIGQPGGSGGGSDYNSSGGTGNTPPVSPPQGNNGGSSSSGATSYGASGGGGAIAAGANGSPSAGGLGGDGAGLPTAFGSNGVPCGSFRYYAGGGSGAGETGAPGPNPAGFPGGKGGGGKGGTGGNPQPSAMRSGGAGTANTGGGGGGTDGTPYPISGGAGGSGIVIIRYKYQ
jgi:hypothetical protein